MCLIASETPGKYFLKEGEKLEPALKRSPRIKGAEPVWLRTTKVYWMPWTCRHKLVTLIQLQKKNLKEWVHLPEEGCQMCLAVPEGQEDGNPGGWKAFRGGKGSSKRELVGPGLILL